MTPNRNVKIPSCHDGKQNSRSSVCLPTRMNIQAQPGRPPFPLISSMAAASKPEKAPDNDDDAKKGLFCREGSSRGIRQAS